MAVRGKHAAILRHQAEHVARWTPRHQPGGVYCSPACGGKCTRKAYERAIHESARVAKTLTTAFGPGWTVDVWENLGWHWRVQRAALTVSKPHTPGDYMVSFDGPPFNPSLSAHYGPLVKTVRGQITQARLYRDSVMAALQAVEGLPR